MLGLFVLLYFILFRSFGTPEPWRGKGGLLSVFPDCHAVFRTFSHCPLSAQLRQIISPLPRASSYELCGAIQIELIHDQLPLAVPCYDLVPVTELTLGPANAAISGTPGSLDLTRGEYNT